MRKSILLLLLSITIRVSSQKICFEDCWSYMMSPQFTNENLDSNGKMDVHKFIASQRKLQKDLIGCKIPDFTVKTLDSTTLILSQLKGKVIVLNFWFKTCEPCVAEMPTLNRLVADYKNTGVIFIAFSKDKEEEIKIFLKDNPFDYTIIPMQIDIEKKFCLSFGYPESMVIDRKGNVRQIFSGGFTDDRAKSAPYDSLQPVINKCLKEY